MAQRTKKLLGSLRLRGIFFRTTIEHSSLRLTIVKSSIFFLFEVISFKNLSYFGISTISSSKGMLTCNFLYISTNLENYLSFCSSFTLLWTRTLTKEVSVLPSLPLFVSHDSPQWEPLYSVEVTFSFFFDSGINFLLLVFTTFMSNIYSKIMKQSIRKLVIINYEHDKYNFNMVYMYWFLNWEYMTYIYIFILIPWKYKVHLFTLWQPSNKYMWIDLGQPPNAKDNVLF